MDSWFSFLILYTVQFCLGFLRESILDHISSDHTSKENHTR